MNIKLSSGKPIRGAANQASEGEEQRSVATALSILATQKLLFDRESAAWALSVSTRTIVYLIASGAFDTRRVGSRVLITASSLKRYAAANHFGPVAGIEVVSHTSNPPMTDPFYWDKCNAIHEAGHAVMALLLGVPLCRVWLLNLA
jgi:hypothetical protein